MRLIDADKVKQYILTEGFYCDTEADRKATAEKIDELFPTVDAIPISWLKRVNALCGQETRLQEAIDLWESREKENES